MPETIPATTIRYAFVPSPIGPLLVAPIDQDIVQVAFKNQNFERVLEQLRTRFGLSVEYDDDALAFAAEQLNEYFAGTRQSFDVPIHRNTTDRFMTRVQQHLVTIACGQTRTYGQLATELKKPGAARAVGSACARNPLPLLQPCHRVVRSDGTLGEFNGTPRAKHYVLALEAGENPEPPTP
ncbi:methylated-DNA--[protein]-cysteine S-methyltransferase [Enteractinococcus helveticum]|uniref:methylated-DNA--[protein]-cysteine S-methyltransferase n=1 Tax=Enteractinococcus helveticum TaxID=1837282 RepID=A0A1B7LYB3_9MICC|nr:methylated-DNA--[protein]-cysteine S-methyltransferase [Enteractinococcus helveticum]OAV60268.1 hypothetical protein A6F49_12905 [Enteractinococcus helveticum]